MSKSRSKKIAEKTIFATFKILKENGGEMRGKDVVDKIRETISFDDYENHRFEKTGYIRWESILHFYTIDCMKAGYLRKQKGIWYLTEEGEKAIDMGAEKLLNSATKLYREWDTKRKAEDDIKTDLGDFTDEDAAQVQKSLISQYEEDAYNGIRNFIISKNPYEFQDLVGQLLTAMGYYISDIAQRGADGGIDLVAYTDPLGTKHPRIIVQVKHRPNDSVSSDEIQKLGGTLKRNSDVGIFVTSGTFSKPAKKEARESREHIELIDFERFVSLWQEYYTKMTDEQKSFLPLHPIYFLGE
ncbi:MAG: Mrr restriction system protein [Flavobacterium lindanitolerans]|uniref:restriction endonuclease n=1 Tax=Flavobacterium lindanitolerans TaxID=428988 RepID=UPI001A5DB96A|nr:Mrr restriction system protein [Flavobacterium lindanitolerans]MBL7869733.1 Mrr restriction system protein [Flavobacterium lindanitolerans]